VRIVIQRFTGVLLTEDDARYLLGVLDYVTQRDQPAPRLADAIRRLRIAVGKPDTANASANENVKDRAIQRDPGEVRAHDLLAAGAAASVIGCSTANVRYLRKRGRLPAHRVGSRWLFPAAPVVEYAERKAARQG
jgi:excisionase family DNA binding protein